MFSAGQSDVEESSFFFHLGGVIECGVVWEDSFGEAGNKNMIKFQAFGMVDSHELDMMMGMMGMIGVSFQANIHEE